MDLNSLVEGYREDIINSTKEIIAIPSVQGEPLAGKPFGEGVAEALDYACNLARNLGFHVVDVDGYGAHAEIGEGDETLGILVHLDVVPAGEGWTYEPYSPQIHDGKLYGRGAIDDKGPTIAAMYAMKALLDSGVKLNKKVRMIFGTDEESGWEGMEYYLSKQPMPQFGIVPDGNYPVIHAEKGILTLAFKKEFNGAEHIASNIEGIKGGTRPNMVPDECLCVFSSPRDGDKVLTYLNTFREYTKCNIEADFNEAGGAVLRFMGKSAHASTPEKGVNAIAGTLGFLCSLGIGNSPMEQFITFLNDRIGPDFDGDGLGIKLEDNVSGKLTLNLGKIDIDKERGEAVINIRYPVEYKLDDIMNRIYKAIEGTDVEVEIQGHSAPLYVPEDHPLVQKLLKIYNEQTGQEAKPIAIGGGTYARATENTVAFGAQFPGRPEMAHQKDEYIEVEDLILNAKIYANAIYELTR